MDRWLMSFHRYRVIAFTEAGDVCTAPAVRAPLCAQSFTLKFVSQRHSGSRALHLGQRRVEIRLIAADVIVVIEWARRDGRKMPGTQHSVTFMRLLRHIENHRYILDSRDVLQQPAALVLYQRDQRLALRGI